MLYFSFLFENTETPEIDVFEFEPKDDHTGGSAYEEKDELVVREEHHG